MSAEEIVAEVLRAHEDLTDRADGCSCGFDDPDQYAAHLAAEVVKALGLVEERHSCEFDGLVVRYVTPWRELAPGRAETPPGVHGSAEGSASTDTSSNGAEEAGA